MLVHSQEMEFNALTYIYPVSNNLVKLTRIKNKSAAHVGMVFENTRLAWYPNPKHCVHDNVPEFIGVNFLHILAA
jgi:hypothetical protein